MTKSIKKIMAAILVVAAMALMIPFSAGAANPPSKTVTFSVDSQEKANAFEFKVYKLADINIDTGAVTAVSTLSDAIKTDIAAEGTDANTAALIAACDADYNSASSTLGTAVTTVAFAENATTAAYTFTDYGIYYVKAVAKNISTKANSSVITVPTLSGTSWTDVGEVSLASKVDTSAVSVGKKITGVTDQTNVNPNYATAGVGDTVSFELSSTVPGTNLKSFAIYDTMESGLAFQNDANVKVNLNGSPLTKGTDYTVVTTGFAYGSGYTFGIEFTADSTGYIPTKFDNGTVTVTYNAKVTADATVGTDSNDNTVKLYYKNSSGVDNTKDGPTVRVYTFLIQVTKTATDGTTPLSGAEFELYESNKTTKIGNAVETDANGVAAFTTQLAAGTYYVKETKAPNGYVLPTGNAAFTQIDITPGFTNNILSSLANVKSGDAALSTVNANIKNTKITVPQTGGMGTAVFTICGALLILLAGVMFVFVKRKKVSK